MTDTRFTPGEKALVSRDESGENHEQATVIDYYVLESDDGDASESA